eukprot:gene27662-31254_t
MFEVGLLDALPTLESHLLTDLHVLDSLLPFHVKRKLQTDTNIYVCSSKKEESTVSRYHPKECKMFSGSITVSAALYLRYRHCWSDGAILVHEFAHAVHDKLVPGGFMCEIIEKAFKVAMESGRFQFVCVYQADGTKLKANAPACINCKEFFAELSTAYLYSSVDKDAEFNRSYPFNHAQLESYDPASFSVIDSVWLQANTSL